MSETKQTTDEMEKALVSAHGLAQDQVQFRVKRIAEILQISQGGALRLWYNGIPHPQPDQAHDIPTVCDNCGGMKSHDIPFIDCAECEQKGRTTTSDTSTLDRAREFVSGTQVLAERDALVELVNTALIITLDPATSITRLQGGWCAQNANGYIEPNGVREFPSVLAAYRALQEAK